MHSPIPCYIGGKGMYATNETWLFKTTLFKLLRDTKLGFDTRHQYYRDQFPDMQDKEFDRMVCDPIEYYDPDWKKQTHSKETIDKEVVKFWLERDLQFQKQATIGVFGLNEPGFGTAINISRFLHNNKPVIAFIRLESGSNNTHNVHNIMQLEITHPHLFSLHQYNTETELTKKLTRLLLKRKR